MARKAKPAAVRKRSGTAGRRRSPSEIRPAGPDLFYVIDDGQGQGKTAPGNAVRSMRKPPPRQAKDWSLRRRPLTEMTAAMMRAATFIAGGELPRDWLLDALPDLVAGLRRLIFEDQAYPGRPKLRRRLEAIAATARLIGRELVDPIMLSLLLRDDRDLIVNESETHAGLNDIAARAEDALKRIPKGQGRAKHYDRDKRFDNMDVCALVEPSMETGAR